ncbi:hypothetical protein ACN20G_20720 [Streptomyces sp. BI20]|uniref:hypothetical protein n=1 Tax=Streptomyces sp. BI20 TaxID=3403460 RepID=UPI003C783DC9
MARVVWGVIGGLVVLGAWGAVALLAWDPDLAAQRAWWGDGLPWLGILPTVLVAAVGLIAVLVDGSSGGGGGWSGGDGGAGLGSGCGGGCGGGGCGGGL